jgi:hypothetical protein
MRARMKRRTGKKAFITDVIVDFWAYIMFVLVVIVFAILYNYAKEAKLQAIEDVKDVTYGNYLAQVYLRTPVDVAGQKMTMAELIALYDYNQTAERRGESREDVELAETRSDIAEVVSKVDVSAALRHAFEDYVGTGNPMRSAIVDITNDFLEKNYDGDRCFFFAIRGNGFEYQRFNAPCVRLGVIGGFFGAVRVDILLRHLPSLPNSSVQTYVASVDPTVRPIVVYSVYDMGRLADIYGEG